MKIYNYHPDYKYFLSKGEADPSPIEPPGCWLIPAHATTKKPPKFKEGEIPVFVEDKWKVVDDQSGIYYNTLRPSEIVVNRNPVEAPEGYTKEQPPEIPNGMKLVWNDGWQLEELPLPPVLSPEEKLAQLGLSTEDLKQLLGLS